MDMEGFSNVTLLFELAQADILRSCLQCKPKRCIGHLMWPRSNVVKTAGLAQLELSPTLHIASYRL